MHIDQTAELNTENMMENNPIEYKYNAELARVVDGDTIVAYIDLGFNTWVYKTIRLEGIDAWESRTKDLEEKKKGIAAKERLSELFKESNNKFILKSNGIGKFGRVLGQVYINKSNVNQLLINEGHAKIYDK